MQLQVAIGIRSLIHLHAIGYGHGIAGAERAEVAVHGIALQNAGGGGGSLRGGLVGRNEGPCRFERVRGLVVHHLVSGLIILGRDGFQNVAVVELDVVEALVCRALNEQPLAVCAHVAGGAEPEFRHAAAQGLHFSPCGGIHNEQPELAVVEGYDLAENSIVLVHNQFAQHITLG